MNKILLVSNTAALLKKRLGTTIDNFDGKILRFNNFELSDEYKPDVGSRINYLSQRACDDIKKINPNTIEKVFICITHSPLSHIMKGVARAYVQHYGSKAIIVPVERTYETHKKIGLNNKERCSVGIITIDFLLEEGYSLELLGFKYNPKEGITHYFKHPPKDARHHNFIKEAKYIKYLLNNNPNIKLFG